MRGIIRRRLNAASMRSRTVLPPSSTNTHTVFISLTAAFIAACTTGLVGYLGFLSANRQTDAQLARLAIDLINGAPQGALGIGQRAVGIRIFERSVGIDLSAEEYSAWSQDGYIPLSNVVFNEILDRGSFSIPEIFLQPCARPTFLDGFTEAGMSQAEAEINWGRDRASLIECGERLDTLVGLVTDAAP